jgi:plastocyanin
VGCSSGSSGSGGTIPPTATLIKAEESITWDAKSYTATPVNGEVTIAVKDESSLPHNLHLLDSGNNDVGIALSVEGRGDVRVSTVALKPGTYQVICTIPGHNNMKATLTVS